MINLPESSVDSCWRDLVDLNTNPLGNFAAFVIFAMPLLFL